MNISLSDWRKVSQPKGSCTIARNLTQRLQNGLELADPKEVQVQKCTKFIFDNEISDSTIQSEWNVVCDDSTLLNVIEMSFLAGAAIGSLSSGILSDEYGRRHTLMIVVTLQAIIGEWYWNFWFLWKALKTNFVQAKNKSNEPFALTLKLEPVSLFISHNYHFLTCATNCAANILQGKNSLIVRQVAS